MKPNYFTLLLCSMILLLMTRCATSDTGFLVNLSPRIPDDSVSLRWSPKGEKLILTEVCGIFTTEFFLGPKELGPVRLVLSKSDSALYPDQLKGDWNRSGGLDDDSVLQAIPREIRGKWWSTFSGSINIPVRDPLTGKPVINPYSLNLWYVFDPEEPDEQPVIRYSRSGWMEGSCKIDTLQTLVLVCENQMDGIYDSLDSWNLTMKSQPDLLYGSESRSCSDHAWIGSRAFRISSIDLSGRQIRLVAYDPGITREGEVAARDILSEDRGASRSGKTVTFSHHYEQALKEARFMQKRLLVDFETTWCGPCKQMDALVYTADLVVEKTIDLLAVKVDGDENRNLVKQYQVTGYPTIILLGIDGIEIRRVVGYQSVSQMVAFLSR